jgi:hypothetical protein
MASSDRIDELKRKFDENPRRYFAPLANEFRKGGDLDQAILICQEFLPQQPGHMSGHIVYGQALYESGRLDEARGVFETALSLDPENLIALRHLGDIAGRQGDPTSARRWYERVLEADPRNDEIQSLLAGLGESPAQEEPVAPSTVAARVEPSFETAPPQESAPPSHAAPAPFGEPELLDLDVTLPDASTVPVAAAAPTDRYEHTDVEPTSHPDIEPTPETADLMPATEARAEGFEATEFSAPDTPVEQTAGLESAFEVETGVHVNFVPPLSGLDRPEPSIDTSPALVTSGVFPELEEALPEDRGDVLPPHGDPIVESEPQPVPTRDETLLDFDMPVVNEPAREPVHAVEEPSQPAAGERVGGDTELPTLPAELPPEVIAAEAELMEAGASVGSPVPDADTEKTTDGESVRSELSFIDVGEASGASTTGDLETEAALEPMTGSARAEEPVPEPAAQPTARPFVTETMAELYLKQGFRQEALSVYERLSSSAPGDERLSIKVASLRAELAAPVRKSNGPPVRDFFARIASRRPGERAVAAALPSEDDFSASEPVGVSLPSSAPASSAEASSAPQPTPAEESPRAGGSIDALFGHRPTSTTEDSAASALAQAFGAASDAPPITGNPARPAAGELTLDSVFREGGARGPRTSQGFSFDQFFSQTVEGDRTSGGDRGSHDETSSGAPAERSEDDIEQFNSWLQGLKQR